MYSRCVCGLYECLINVHTGSFFFFKKYSCLSLPPVYSSTTVVSKFYFRVSCAKVWTYEYHLYFDPHIFVFARVVNPVPCSTKWNLLVYQSLQHPNKFDIFRAGGDILTNSPQSSFSIGISGGCNVLCVLS